MITLFEEIADKEIIGGYNILDSNDVEKKILWHGTTINGDGLRRWPRQNNCLVASENKKRR